MEENLEPLEDQVTDTIICSSCSKPTEDCDAVDTEDGLVCEKCFEDNYANCCNCHKAISNDDSCSNEGDIYCERCYGNLEYCERCEERGDDLSLYRVDTRAGEEMWCESCTDNHAYYCDRCNEYISDYYERWIVRTIGTICEGCRDSIGTFECCDCCNEWPMDYCSNSDEDDSDQWCCNRCSENRGGAKINSYSYKPTPIFFKAKDEKLKDADALYFGIELEVERHESRIGLKQMAEEIEHSSYYFKSDGSLNNGFEIVTHPMTIDYIQENKVDVFKSMLDKLIASKYRSYDSTTCGMHIHLTKKAFGTWQLYRFIKFFVDNKDFVTSISQRKTEQLERWATIEEENDNSIIYKAKKKDGNSRRYVAINLQNHSTIELRIFRGTLNYQSFMKNIEFTHALFNFTRDVKDTSIEQFKQYINQSSEYTMLKKFIKLKNL